MQRHSIIKGTKMSYYIYQHANLVVYKETPIDVIRYLCDFYGFDIYQAYNSLLNDMLEKMVRQDKLEFPDIGLIISKPF